MRKITPVFSFFVSAVSFMLSGVVRADLEEVQKTEAPLPAAVRLPWTRGNLLFQRQWILLGPIRADHAPGQPPEIDLAIEPKPWQAQPLRNGGQTDTVWVATTSWSDVLDLSENPGSPPGGPTDPAPAETTKYAFTTYTAEHEGPADLSLGLDGKVEIWVNGVNVPVAAGPFEFQKESTRVRVQLKAGANALLLRLSHHRSPWLLALRVVAPGAVLSDADEIEPVVLSGLDAKELAVRTDRRATPGGAKVRIDLIAAGGRVVASAEVPRGETLRLPSTGWPEGAYEVRCTTQTSWGQSFVTYLPWYYGDAAKAVRRLEAAAGKAGSDPAGATVRMLAELVRDRLGKSSERALADTARKVHSPLLEFEELEQLASGGTGPVHGGGFVRLAYADPVDGSVQFCRAYLPPDYEASRAWPVILFLHGFNPENPAYVRWWSIDQRHSNVADRHGTILLEVHGRGNAQYSGIGEEDVLRALREAKARFHIDEDRVYLTGESMGGHGTWYIASRHPDIFAAAAPVYGGWDFRISSVSAPGALFPSARNAREAFLQEASNSFANAENLLNLPLYVHHGDSDPAVHVINSRHIVGMLQRWGYDVRYREHVGRGHEDLGAREEIADWLLIHRRANAPRRVRLQAVDLRSAGNSWLRVDAFEEPSRLIVADAEVVRPGTIRLDTNNVATVSFELPKALQSADGSLAVIWNGASRRVSAQNGRATIRWGSATEGGLKKRAGLEGPLADLIRTPFAVVIGTSSTDPAMRNYCARKAEVFSQLWEQWQHQVPRVMKDREVTPAEEKAYSLLLIGGPDANLVSRRLGSAFPLQINGDEITVDGKSWSVKDGYVQMIYPSPFHEERYVMVVAGTSASGLYFWKPFLWGIPLGYANNPWDWMIQDGRRILPSKDILPHDGWIASGVFDAGWRRKDEWTTMGKTELRDRSVLRHPPKPGVSLPPSLLTGIAGRYELFPGVVASVSVREGEAFVQFPGSKETKMTFVHDTEFVWDETVGEAVFEGEGNGSFASVKIYFDGQELVAKRVP